MINITIDPTVPGTSYRPHWNRLVTAGRAHEGMYAPWREQLKKMQA